MLRTFFVACSKYLELFCLHIVGPRGRCIQKKTTIFATKIARGLLRFVFFSRHLRTMDDGTFLSVGCYEFATVLLTVATFSFLK